MEAADTILCDDDDDGIEAVGNGSAMSFDRLRFWEGLISPLSICLEDEDWIEVILKGILDIYEISTVSSKEREPPSGISKVDSSMMACDGRGPVFLRFWEAFIFRPSGCLEKISHSESKTILELFRTLLINLSSFRSSSDNAQSSALPTY